MAIPHISLGRPCGELHPPPDVSRQPDGCPIFSPVPEFGDFLGKTGAQISRWERHIGEPDKDMAWEMWKKLKTFPGYSLRRKNHPAKIYDGESLPGMWSRYLLHDQRSNNNKHLGGVFKEY